MIREYGAAGCGLFLFLLFPPTTSLHSTAHRLHCLFLCFRSPGAPPFLTIFIPYRSEICSPADPSYTQSMSEMDASQLGRWTRFAAKGGIGKCTAIQDCVAERAEDLMFMKVRPRSFTFRS